MDKNIIAFIREDVKTVKVKFFADVKMGDNWEAMDRYSMQSTGKEYTYLCTFPNPKPADLAIVLVGNRPVICEIQSVDETLDIPPNDMKEYKYIAAIVDLSAYIALMEKNKELKDMLAASYRKNTQRSFRAACLADMDDESRTRLLEVLK